jgi:hypothetical protein
MRVATPLAAADSSCASQPASPEQKAVEGEQRAALAKVLPFREKELGEARREDAVQEVIDRATRMGVTAPPEAMTDLLFLEEWIRLEIDWCTVYQDCSAECVALRDQTTELDRLFRELAGLSMEEFRSGRPGSFSSALDRCQS